MAAQAFGGYQHLPQEGVISRCHGAVIRGSGIIQGAVNVLPKGRDLIVRGRFIADASCFRFLRAELFQDCPVLALFVELHMSTLFGPQIIHTGGPPQKCNCIYRRNDSLTVMARRGTPASRESLVSSAEETAVAATKAKLWRLCCG